MSEVEVQKQEKTGIVRYICVIFTCVIGILSGLIVALIRWVFQTWNHLNADELFYQLKAPMQGTNQDMIWDAVFFCVPWMILFLLIIIVVFLLVKDKDGKYFWLTMAGTIIICIGTVAGSLYYAWQRLDITAYMENKDKFAGFIDQNYVSPADVKLEFPEKKRNLIYIFLESMEVTYADKENGGGFDVNCIPELTTLAQQNEDFSGSDPALNGGYDMPSTTWTVAAMFAHTSGLPLSISIGDNEMNTQSEFMPGVVTLGDLLQVSGYNQKLIIGSDATFGGRRLLFSEHGDYDIVDHPYALSIGRLPQGYHEWWGYRDSLLFEYAKEELMDMASKDEPFNCTLLTVDTHFEDGFLCDLCPDTFGDNRYANVMACSSKQVYDFVEWIKQQDFYENTTIIIAGDHHTMDSNFCEDVDEDYVRRVYTTVINPAAEVADPESRREYTTFDMFPTTLASLGVNIEGDRLGLGTNLFSDTPTLLEVYGMEEMSAGVSGKSELMDYFTKDIDESKVESKDEESKKEWYDQKLESMTLEEKVAQMFIVSPEDVAGSWRQVDADDSLMYGLERFPVGGLIYDEDNIENREQISGMINGSQQYIKNRINIPLLEAIQEESGQNSLLASNETMGVPWTKNAIDIDSADRASLTGLVMGKYLSDIGFNLNLGLEANVEGDINSFGTDPVAVSEKVESVIDGLHVNGVYAAVKYFPGYHMTQLFDENGQVRNINDILGDELYPFQQAVKAERAFIMVGHESIPELTGEDLPASMSGAVANSILRGMLDYNGVVITDALDKDEIIYNYGSEYSAIMAVQAGCDMLLKPYDFQSAYYAVLNAVYNGTISEERINTSVRRILKMKQNIVMWDMLKEVQSP